ncbi:hypothetical protein CCMA1212_010114 [Trichoderma ghanense]|uniref:Uncharacterized protein n=1 Tax=Trichoderma ghanense TaxID=65468 RepID=A0ABY2GQD8_9HYPO
MAGLELCFTADVRDGNWPLALGRLGNLIRVIVAALVVAVGLGLALTDGGGGRRRRAFVLLAAAAHGASQGGGRGEPTSRGERLVRWIDDPTPTAPGNWIGWAASGATASGERRAAKERRELWVMRTCGFGIKASGRTMGGRGNDGRGRRCGAGVCPGSRETELPGRGPLRGWPDGRSLATRAGRLTCGAAEPTVWSCRCEIDELGEGKLKRRRRRKRRKRRLEAKWDSNILQSTKYR